MTNQSINQTIIHLQDTIKERFDASTGVLSQDIIELQEGITNLQDICPHNEGITTDDTCKICYKYLG